jgi:hypothetical protein
MRRASNAVEWLALLPYLCKINVTKSEYQLEFELILLYVG